jgi:hypothetical protein
LILFFVVFSTFLCCIHFLSWLAASEQC